MARQPTTRLQVSGYRFLVRRMEHALLRGDMRMLHDPMRAQSLSLIAGCVLAVVVVAVCAILAFLRPNAGLGDAAIVMSRDSGALYVRVDDTLHPVLNLASARLVTGNVARARKSSVRPTSTRPSAVRCLGIPGAPAVIAKPLSDEESAWTVCDGTTTTVIAGQSEASIERDNQPNVLVTPRSESAATTYLLYDGWRAEVDLRNPGVVWALRLDGIEPRPVSRALLDAIPEAPPIAPPHIRRRGPAGRYRRHAGRDGGAGDASRRQRLFRRAGRRRARIGEVAANLIRAVDSQGSREIASVSPDAVGDVPVVDSLPASTFPAARARPQVRAATACCARSGCPTGPKTVLWVGRLTA